MPKFLHVYAQPGFHEEAYLVGNREALAALRDAIDRALHNERAALGAFTTDGEGYTVIVIADSGDAIKIGLMSVPYTNDYAKEGRDRPVWPQDLLKPDERLALEKEAWNR